MSLAEHLRYRKQHLESLRSLLSEERELLTVGQVDGARLNGVASRKQEHLAALEGAEQQWRESGQVPEDDSDHAAERAGCLPLWRDTGDLARQVARLNRLNGQLIQLRLEHNQRLLNTLREAAGGELYGPDGQARGKSGRLSSSV